jgi:EmrB/QacA subfamily drug resistance transporter
VVDLARLVQAMTLQVIAPSRLPAKDVPMRNEPGSSSVPLAPAAGAARRLPLLVMLGGTFMVVLDFFIVNVALPSLQRELRASGAALQMVVAGYGIANAAGLVTAGRLGDLFGRRRMFMLGVLLFTLASLACGLAPNAPVLVGARVAQGLAGALLQPQVLAMLGLIYTGAARARAFAAYGVTLGLGATLGQLIGGVLIALDPGGLGWRSCFLINLPIGLAVLLLVPRTVPPLANTASSRLDLPGALLVGLASIAVVWPLVEGREQGWPAWSMGVLFATLPLLAVFAWQQRRLAGQGGDPLLAPALLAHRAFRGGLLTTLVFYAGNASQYFVLALYLQQGLALGPLASGLVFTCLATGFFAASLAAPRLAARLGGPPIVPGALLLAAGHALQLVNMLCGADQVLGRMLPALAVQGVGLGLVMSPLVSAVLAGLPAQHAGLASGVLGTVQQVGNAVGVALIGLVFYGTLGSGTRADYDLAYAASLVFLAVSALLVAALYRRERR